MAITHEHLWTICRRLPTDYTDYGGTVERWSDPNLSYADCSCGCRWAAWLEEPFGGDWCVCTNPDAPRAGLLTFEHMTGSGCFEPSDDDGGEGGI
jgi:hypothetical protein